MKDFVPLGSGNSRFLKTVNNAKTLYPTYDAFLNALIAGTLPIDLNGINSAGVAQMGTALNKANLLTDATASELGLTGDPTVNDALLSLLPKVGDTLTTARTDLGDKWLLCNGEPLNTSDYPDLSDLIPANIEGEWEKKNIGVSTKIYNIAYHDGVYLATGTENNYNAIFVSDSYLGPYSTVWTSEVRQDGRGKIAYYNGTWGVLFQDYNGYKNILVSDNPRGTWTSHRIIDNTYYAGTGLAVSDSGVWVATAGYSDGYNTQGAVYYTTDPRGTWTLCGSWGSGDTSLAYANGYFVGAYRDVNAVLYIMYTSNPESQSWQSYHAGNMGGSARVFYRNGLWIASANDGLYVSANTPTDWTKKTINGDYGEYSKFVGAAAFVDGRWLCVALNRESGSTAYLYTSIDGNSWGSHLIQESLGGRYQIVDFVPPSSDGVLLVSISSDGLAEMKPVSRLPTISNDGVYTYIKAKE